MSSAVARMSRAGRKQESARTGPGFRLAEWLNENWSHRTDLTNAEVAERFGLVSPGQVSMWRTGKCKVALEWLPQLSRLLDVDIAFLLRLWIEQYLGEDVEGMQEINSVFARMATESEAKLLNAVRPVRGGTAEFDQAEIDAVSRLLRASRL